MGDWCFLSDRCQIAASASDWRQIGLAVSDLRCGVDWCRIDVSVSVWCPIGVGFVSDWCPIGVLVAVWWKIGVFVRLVSGWRFLPCRCQIDVLVSVWRQVGVGMASYWFRRQIGISMAPGGLHICYCAMLVSE